MNYPKTNTTNTNNMLNKPIITRTLCNVVLIAGVILCAISSAAGNTTFEKPVLIMGESYGIHERQALIEELLVREAWVYVDGGAYQSAKTWHDYALVIICDDAPQLSDPEQLAAAQKYIRQGGRILGVGSFMNTFRNVSLESMAWIGATGFQYGLQGAIHVTASDMIPEHIDVDAMRLAFASPYAANAMTTGQPLLTKANAPVAFVHSYGHGEVVVVGRELFRVRVLEKQTMQDHGGDALRDWFATIIKRSQPLTRARAIEHHMNDFPRDKPVVWFRDPGHQSRGADYFVQPFPRSHEQIKSIRMDMGIGEFESFPIYVTARENITGYRVNVSNLLHTNKQHQIASEKFRIRKQGLAAPHLTVGDYWLLDPNNPQQPAFDLQANKTATIWFTFDTTDIKPGEYLGQIQLGEQTVEFKIKVWDVALPSEEYFEAQATFMWASLGIDPTQAGKSPLDFSVFDRHLDNLAAHHVSYNSDVYWPLYLAANALIRDTGQTLPEAIANKTVTMDKLPDLDFSMFNHFVDAAVARDMPWMHCAIKNLPTEWYDIAKRITHNPALERDGPEHQRIKSWMLNQTLDFFASRGIYQIMSFHADEIGLDKVEHEATTAQLIADRGIHPMFTVTVGPGESLDALRRLRPICDVWIWNITVLQHVQETLKQYPSLLKPDDLQYTYTADWNHASYMLNRERGVFFAHEKLNGWYIHGYLRWYPNGGAVFGGKSGPIDTEGWEGARDGIEDARYFARITELADRLINHHDPRARKIAQQTQRDIQQWIAPDQSDNDPYVRMIAKSYEKRLDYYLPHSNLIDIRQLKSIMLERLAALEKFDTQTPRLEYADAVIAIGDSLNIEIAGHDVGGNQLRQSLAEKISITQWSDTATLLAVDKPNTSTHQQAQHAAKTHRVLIGSEDDHPLIQQLAQAGRLGVTARYPGPQDFRIVHIPATASDNSTNISGGNAGHVDNADGVGTGLTVIFARDSEGITRGVQQFVHLARLRIKPR